MAIWYKCSWSMKMSPLIIEYLLSSFLCAIRLKSNCVQCVERAMQFALWRLWWCHSDRAIIYMLCKLLRIVCLSVVFVPVISYFLIYSFVRSVGRSFANVCAIFVSPLFSWIFNTLRRYCISVTAIYLKITDLPRW